MKQSAKRLLSVLALVVLAFWFAGCEDDCDEETVIRNKSSHTVTLEIQRGHHSPNHPWEILTLEPGTKQKFHDFFWYGSYTPADKVVMISEGGRWSSWIEFYDRVDDGRGRGRRAPRDY